MEVGETHHAGPSYLFEFKNNDLDPVFEQLSRRIIQSPFNAKKCARPYKVAQEVRMMVSAVNAMKTSRLRLNMSKSEERTNSKSKLPLYIRVKKAIISKDPKKTLGKSLNEGIQVEALSKEVQLSGEGFSCELISAHSSPFYDKIREVMSHNTALTQIQFNFEEQFAMFHKTHSNQILTFGRKKAAACRCKQDDHHTSS